jgi:hypothetical protein
MFGILKGGDRATPATGPGSKFNRRGPLPAARFVISRRKTAKVNIDFHVDFEAHNDSLPHRLVGAKVDVRATGALLDWFASNRRGAGHPVGSVRGGFTTTPEHMPASHRAHLEWTPAKCIAWGQGIGVSTAAVATWQFEHRPHPEQGYRTCRGLFALERRHSDLRLEGACTRAMSIHSEIRIREARPRSSSITFSGVRRMPQGPDGATPDQAAFSCARARTRSLWVRMPTSLASASMTGM